MSNVDGVEFEEEGGFGNSIDARPIKFVNSTGQKVTQTPINPQSSSALYKYVQARKKEDKGMTAWLIRNGWAKSPSGAQKILFGVIIINIIITILAIIL